MAELILIAALTALSSTVLVGVGFLAGWNCGFSEAEKAIQASQDHQPTP